MHPASSPKDKKVIISDRKTITLSPSVYNISIKPPSKNILLLQATSHPKDTPRHLPSHPHNKPHDLFLPWPPSTTKIHLATSICCICKRYTSRPPSPTQVKDKPRDLHPRQTIIKEEVKSIDNGRPSTARKNKLPRLRTGPRRKSSRMQAISLPGHPPRLHSARQSARLSANASFALCSSYAFGLTTWACLSVRDCVAREDWMESSLLAWIRT